MRVGANWINGCIILHSFNLIGWLFGGDEFCLIPGSGMSSLNARSKARTPGNQSLMQTSICAKIPVQTILWTTQLGKLLLFWTGQRNLGTKKTPTSKVSIGCSRGGATGGSGNFDPGKRRHQGPTPHASSGAAAPAATGLVAARPGRAGATAGHFSLPPHAGLGCHFPPKLGLPSSRRCHRHSRSPSPGRIKPAPPFQRGREGTLGVAPAPPHSPGRVTPRGLAPGGTARHTDLPPVEAADENPW